MLAPVVRGGAAGVLALLKRALGRGVRGSLANAAERFLRRQVELEDASPFHDAPAARTKHAARLSEAQVALQEGRPARMAVGVAAAGAGVLAPVVRGGAAGVRALLKRAHGHRMRGSLAKAAERFLRRHVELEDASPFHAAPAGRFQLC